MNFLTELKELICHDSSVRTELALKETRINELNKKYSKLVDSYMEQDLELQQLENDNHLLLYQLARGVWDDEKALFYNDRYEQNKLEYPADQTEEKIIYRDPRTFFSEKSHILEKVKIAGFSDDEKAMSILKYVKMRLAYKSESKELWREPEVTYQKRVGDCEDGALLIGELLKLSGVPSWRWKVICGDVNLRGETIGHAWIGYRREKDDEMVCLDWCYYYTTKGINDRKLLKEDDRYFKGEKIWYTFNDEFTWSNKPKKIDARVTP